MTNDTTIPTSFPSISPTSYPSLNLHPTLNPTTSIIEKTYSSLEPDDTSELNNGGSDYAVTVISLGISGFLLFLMIALFVFAYMIKNDHKSNDNVGTDLFQSLSKLCDFESVTSSIHGNTYCNNIHNSNHFDGTSRDIKKDNTEYYNNFWGEQQQRSRSQRQIEASYHSSTQNNLDGNNRSNSTVNRIQSWLDGDFPNLHM